MAGFTYHHDRDSSTAFCPCGSSLINSSFTSDDEVSRWFAKHTPHTDTKVDKHHVTEDGMREWSGEQDYTMERP